MPRFINKRFIKYYLGDKKIRSHIDAVHACPPQSDKYTGEIVESVANKTSCSAIISTVSRTTIDLNRPRNADNRKAIDEYRETIREFLEHKMLLDKDGQLLKPYLHLVCDS